MRFYDVLVNRSVPTEANRGLTSYIEPHGIPQNLMKSHGTSWNPMEGSGTWRNLLVADK
jgi:hypothetical protein